LSRLVWFFLWLPEEVLALLFLLHHENGDFSILMKDIVSQIISSVDYYTLHLATIFLWVDSFYVLSWVFVVPKKFSFALVGCLNETLYWPSFVRFYVHGVGGEGEGAELHHFTTSSNLQWIALLEGTLGKPPPWGFTLNKHNLVSIETQNNQPKTIDPV
jgi:hypothetical protein